jgi:enoyl-CoA hydratase/carnithine racemase
LQLFIIFALVSCLKLTNSGGGIDLITACDIRLCTKDAKFSVRETKIAITADLGTLQRLTKIMGKGFAVRSKNSFKKQDGNGFKWR